MKVATSSPDDRVPTPVVDVVLRRHDGAPLWITYKDWTIGPRVPVHCAKPSEEMPDGGRRCVTCWAQLSPRDQETALWLAQ